MRVRGILLLLLYACSFLASAEVNGESVVYSGQEREFVQLERMIFQTAYRQEQYEGSCTRQIPYQTTVCEDVTRYRQSCRYVDGHQDCSTRYENDCHYVTRYREVCRHKPSRRVCRRKPGRQVCRERDGRRVCHNVPGEEVCRNVPGQRVCERKPYEDYVCERVPRRHCTWIPGQNVCRQIPYTENVCNEVTRYRDEQYTCTLTRDVPYQVEKKVVAEFNMMFSGDYLPRQDIELFTSLDEQGAVRVKIAESPIYFIKSQRVLNRADGEEIRVNGDINFKFFSKGKVLSLVKVKPTLATFNKSELVFRVGHRHNLVKPTVGLELIRQRKILSDKTLINRTLNKGEYSLHDGLLTINLKQFDFAIKDKSHKIRLELRIDLDSSINSSEHQFFNNAEFTKKP